MNWIYLAYALDQWWALVKKVINYRVPLNAENLTEGLLACHEGLQFIDFLFLSFLSLSLPRFSPSGMTFILFRVVTFFVALKLFIFYSSPTTKSACIIYNATSR